MRPFLTARSENLLPKGEAVHRPTRFSRAAIREQFRRIPVHTFFLAAYPIVSLLAINIGQIYARDALKSLLISLSTVSIIFRYSPSSTSGSRSQCTSGANFHSPIPNSREVIESVGLASEMHAPMLSDIYPPKRPRSL